MTEPNLDNVRQQIYDVLNVHKPTDCGSGRCWGVEEIEKIIANQVREARIDERSQTQQYLHGLTITPESQHLFDVLSRNNHNRIATLNGVKK